MGHRPYFRKKLYGNLPITTPRQENLSDTILEKLTPYTGMIEYKQDKLVPALTHEYMPQWHYQILQFTLKRPQLLTNLGVIPRRLIMLCPPSAQGTYKSQLNFAHGGKSHLGSMDVFNRSNLQETESLWNRQNPPLLVLFTN